MNEQQQRMAAVETDKELSDLLDFSAVRERALGGSGRWVVMGGGECDTGLGIGGGQRDVG